jgi:hypothetical protein
MVDLVQSGGGGYGDPLERDIALVLRDLEDELVGVAEARELYGVVASLEGYDYVVDFEATEASRAARNHEPTPNVVKGCITLDDAAYAEWQNVHPTPPIPHPEDQAIEQARGVLDHETCLKVCPLRADAKRCPFHSEEALNYWSSENLRRWTSQHCLQKGDVLPQFRVARIY